jgi:hypothetical protein
VAGSGTGAFSTTITGLSSDTRYYARAYVVHATGTVYGNEINFLTDAAAPDPVLLARPEREHRHRPRRGDGRHDLLDQRVARGT